MKMSTVFKMIVSFTVVGLMYVHLQTNIIVLAYQGKTLEKQIRSLIEDNGEVTYNILTLKSSIYLGEHMLDDGQKMKFADPGSVISMRVDFEDLDETPFGVTAVASREDPSGFVSRLFSLGTSAEAWVNR
jgi:hypothetical protein